MRNITKNDINEIREIKETIKNAEISLEKFMNEDLSDARVRAEMRSVLSGLENLETGLSQKLENLK